MSQQQIDLPALQLNNEAMPSAPEPVQTKQPAVAAPMDPQRPHAEHPAELRGGDRGGLCPGRFCFIIPCPLPCDCCII